MPTAIRAGAVSYLNAKPPYYRLAEVAPRVSLVLKADIRPGFTGQLTAKVERVQAVLDTGT